jgi:AraC-like DNA-binding protein
MTGETPRDIVERIRIDAARGLFGEAQSAVQVVAWRCGFATVDNLRRAFVRRLGVTPQQYRQRFRLADSEASSVAADRLNGWPKSPSLWPDLSSLQRHAWRGHR